ncbi:hypothetical protein C725_2096 [Pacificimonas flava]|uniref:Uncharacterized protein n=1 Tax=Pacificimonas flava TaxID=1234595 RepID=M2SAK2_9SPHN|nr:hypothetical protein C725_2096 [Pacificimonas flava]
MRPPAPGRQLTLRSCSARPVSVAIMLFSPGDELIYSSLHVAGVGLRRSRRAFRSPAWPLRRRLYQLTHGSAPDTPSWRTSLRDTRCPRCATTCAKLLRQSANGRAGARWCSMTRSSTTMRFMQPRLPSSSATWTGRRITKCS